jgi:NAD(P)-dependent dehydrogenase (short-subunit alcohol dehydrogenase family)
MSKPVVLITGALTGIGHATALAFARDGSRIVVSGRHEDKGQALAAEVRALGAEAEFIRADVRHEGEVRNLIDRTMERFGRLDVAVNNAGTEGELGPIVEQSVANYESIFAVNVLGTLLSLKHEMRVMLAQGSGSIINLSSIGGQVGFAGAAVYAASKHAVEGLTKSAALEGARAGVRVNAVAPGPTETQMLDRFVGRSDEAKARFVATIPSGRASTADEIAATIVFLASDKARSLTGQRIAVDGAYTAQ